MARLLAFSLLLGCAGSSAPIDHEQRRTQRSFLSGMQSSGASDMRASKVMPYTPPVDRGCTTSVSCGGSERCVKDPGARSGYCL